MKAILVMFDSLSRKFLPPYGNDWVHAPAFQRLAGHSVTFDKCFVGSMPCMPARRELHTGRYNFLHRSWGPLEPFDDSMPELLTRHGVYTHLVSDHYHYWEDGGATYHNRYSSWESVRGQEGDKWKGEVADPDVPEHAGVGSRQDWINRTYMAREEDTSQAQTFRLGVEFIEKNHAEDDWFLQIECFDPHPPFFAPQRFVDLYADDYDGPQFDWPPYAAVGEEDTPERIEHCRRQYAATVSHCDHSLGLVLDAMDRHGLWDDTMLIVTTDHGFLLGEHGWWAFCKPPFFDEVAVKPLFAWDPRSGRRGERCAELAQMHDVPATLLEYFGAELPRDMLGIPLPQDPTPDRSARDAVLFGIFGGHVNVSDGRYVYMRAPASAENQPLYNYTVMPTHMRKHFGPEEMRTAELAGPFPFTKDCRVLRTEAQATRPAPLIFDAYSSGTLLYDLATDPGQERPLEDSAVEARMMQHLVRLIQGLDTARR